MCHARPRGIITGRIHKNQPLVLMMCVSEGEVVFGPPLLLLSLRSVAFYHSGFYTSVALKMKEGQGWARSTFPFSCQNERERPSGRPACTNPMKKLDFWLIIDWLPVHSWKRNRIELPSDEYMRLTNREVGPFISVVPGKKCATLQCSFTRV